MGLPHCWAVCLVATRTRASLGCGSSSTVSISAALVPSPARAGRVALPTPATQEPRSGPGILTAQPSAFDQPRAVKASR